MLLGSLCPWGPSTEVERRSGITWNWKRGERENQPMVSRALGSGQQG